MTKFDNYFHFKNKFYYFKNKAIHDKNIFAKNYTTSQDILFPLQSFIHKITNYFHKVRTIPNKFIKETFFVSTLSPTMFKSTAKYFFSYTF